MKIQERGGNEYSEDPKMIEGCNPEPRKRKKKIMKKLAFLFHYNESEEWKENVAIAEVIFRNCRLVILEEMRKHEILKRT